MVWLYIAVWVVSLVVAYSMIPKPTEPPPVTLEEVKTPQAKEGMVMIIVFGTKDISRTNTLWHGDFEAIPIRKKSGKK